MVEALNLENQNNETTVYVTTTVNVGIMLCQIEFKIKANGNSFYNSFLKYT